MDGSLQFHPGRLAFTELPSELKVENRPDSNIQKSHLLMQILRQHNRYSDLMQDSQDARWGFVKKMLLL